MSTILRPDSIVSSTGFDVSGSTLLSRINDNNLASVATQSTTNSEIVCGLENGTFSADEIFSSITISVTAVAGRTGSTTASAKLLTGIGTDSIATVHSDTLSFGGSQTTETSSAYTTSTNLQTLHNMGIQINPSTSGITIAEIFLTVVSGPPPSGKMIIHGGKVLLKQGKIIMN